MPTQTDIDQLARYRARLAPISAAIEALIVGNLQSYTMDTVQGRQVVTKQNLVVLTDYEDKLLNRIAVLEARCGVGGADVVVYAGPAF
jgi:hypothetical protein